jgi:DNA-binding response OmpR family regulator
LDGEEYIIRWVSSTTQALELDLRPSLLILDLPPSGGQRSTARLKRAFGMPLLAIARPGLPLPESVDVSLPRPYQLEQLADEIETALIVHSPGLVRAGGMSLDTQTRRLQVNGALHQLRPLACQILAHLMARPGQAVSREDLFRRVWHTDDGDNTRALDVHISYLRRELEPNPREPTLILTERGLGYRLEPPEPLA